MAHPVTPAQGVGCHAWVDESMRLDISTNAGDYILAAVVADPGICESVRDRLRDLLLRRQERLHWRDEDDNRRDHIAATAASFDAAAVVVVGAPLIKSKQERARRICLETMLPFLEELGVSQAWMESRGDNLNVKDREMVEAMRGQRLITPGIRVDAELPSHDPMLWTPDIIAGAVNAARSGNPRWFAPVRHLNNRAIDRSPVEP